MLRDWNIPYWSLHLSKNGRRRVAQLWEEAIWEEKDFEVAERAFYNSQTFPQRKSTNNITNQ